MKRIRGNAIRDDSETDSLLGWLGFLERPFWSRSRMLGSAIGCLLVVIVPVLFFLAVFAAVDILWSSITYENPDGAGGGGLGLGALIAGLLGAPFLIWGTFLKFQSVHFQKQGHITDRINDALNLLGLDKSKKTIHRSEDQAPTVLEETVPNIEVRIGALLSLERIAQDSVRYDSGRDYPRVMEIIYTYIKENASKQHYSLVRIKGSHLDGHSTREAVLNDRHDMPAVRADVLTAIRIIARRSNKQISIENAARTSGGKKFSIDLSDTVLIGADFSGCDLSGVIFDGANLSYSKFHNVNLEDASFDRAALICIDAREVNFTGSHLWKANLSYSKLSAVEFSKCLFADTRVLKANIDGCIFEVNWKCPTEYTPKSMIDIHDCTLSRVDIVNMPNWGFNVGWSDPGAISRSGGAGEIRLRGGRVPSSGHWYNIVKNCFGDGTVTVPSGMNVNWPVGVLDAQQYEREYDKWRQARLGPKKNMRPTIG